MEDRTLMMLRVFANRYNPLAGDALLKFLPKETMQAVLEQNIKSNDLTPLLEQPRALLKNLHHTWIKPILDQMPERLHPLIISALNPDQIAGLQASQPPLNLSPPVKNFFLNYIFNALNTEDHLPIEYLPLTELTPLSTWTKGQLVNLADFLGLHDLASEVRRIVNKDYLRNIYSCLTPHQYNYLNICLHQRERIVAPRLGIDPSVKDCTKLKQTVHKRGLMRLGRSLCGEHADLVWYISHILDRGRGKILLSTHQPEVEPNITALLKIQVTNVMNFLKTVKT
jgi:hypothetical protein